MPWKSALHPSHSCGEPEKQHRLLFPGSYIRLERNERGTRPVLASALYSGSRISIVHITSISESQPPSTM